ncbi:MAG: ABC transporter ATP-binding protein [Rhodospirillales bacterium]|jgi:branched-chain amino acid transport system ATP-binding protein|nr:ABC transporter ATP-binding protein [Rhodospirillales bacterium]
MTALTVENIVAGYESGMPIVRDVSFSLDAGEIVTVIGPNGAGKSTLTKAIAGLVPERTGCVLMDGKPITAPAHALAHVGIAFVPQTENVFTRLTIRENLQIGAALLPRARRAGRIDAVLDMFPDLATRPTLAAGRLSGGQRQMLAIARALIAEPRVLLLDEPSAGLSPALVEGVFSSIAAIAAGGVSVALVEQNVAAALRIAHRALVLVEGRVAHDGPADPLRSGKLLARLFLGGTGDDPVT